MKWGKHKEGGLWRALVSQYRVRVVSDALYVAVGFWRLRVMKPW